MSNSKSRVILSIVLLAYPVSPVSADEAATCASACLGRLVGKINQTQSAPNSPERLRQVAEFNSCSAACNSSSGKEETKGGPVDCDFDRPLGQCTGKIEIVSVHGSKKSYGAEVRVISSAEACSKVEYFVNSTPYTTVLTATNSEPESLSGTNPISAQDIELKTCTAFATHKAK